MLKKNNYKSFFLIHLHLTVDRSGFCTAHKDGSQAIVHRVCTTINKLVEGKSKIQSFMSALITPMSWPPLKTWTRSQYLAMMEMEMTSTEAPVYRCITRAIVKSPSSHASPRSNCRILWWHQFSQVYIPHLSSEHGNQAMVITCSKKSSILHINK